MRPSPHPKSDADIPGRPNPFDSSLVGISTTVGMGRVYIVLAIMITGPAAYKKPETALIVRSRARPEIKIDDQGNIGHKTERIIRSTAAIRIVVAAIAPRKANA